jgi:hypothetical protein
MVFACGEKSSKILWRKVQQNAAAANAVNQFGGGCGLQDTYAETHFFGNGISKLVFAILSALEPLAHRHRRSKRRLSSKGHVWTGAPGDRQVPMFPVPQKATWPVLILRDACRPRVVVDPGMRRKRFAREPGDPDHRNQP